MLRKGGEKMKRKVLSLLLCIVMLIGILPVYAFAEEDTSDWTYEANRGGTGVITGYNGSDTELVFPKRIDGYTMVGIADNAFDYEDEPNSTITKITIPDTYTRIGNNSFNWSLALKEIELPDTIEYIGYNSFSKSAYYLNQKHELRRNKQPEVVYIGEYLIKADHDAYYMPDCLTIKQGTKLIAAGAFFNNNHIKNVIIPEGVEYINQGAFAWCDSLKSIVLPNTVERIENISFAVSDNLRAIVIPESVEYIDDGAFFSQVFMQFVTVYGVKGSLAEKFANEKGTMFVELKDVLYGDVDGDGQISVNDYASAASCAIGNTEFDGNQEVIGDMNGDCVIDAFDAAAIDRIIAN